jgi:phospholipid/cholesterol/gamma-HCH transport system ATP-binding protein
MPETTPTPTAGAAETPKIALVDVYKSFGPKKVLAGVNLAVAPGESLVIIGGSGTGKSVTLKCMLGILKPDKGEVLIDGTPLAQSDRGAFLNDFGMLFQGGALFDSLTVWQNVAFRLRRAPFSLAKKAARDRAIEKLARVGLGPETADLFPAELSGGMQKRVGLARAIATDPHVMFFDEPTAGLDPIMAGVINDLIRELVTEMGATAVTITHDMTTVRTVADNVAMLHDGLVRWHGPVGDIDDATDPYLDQFIHGRATGPIAAIR